MADCLRGQPVFLVPLTGPPVQLGYKISFLLVQALAQKVSEKLVIAIPAPLVIQRNDKEIVTFEIFQRIL